MSSSWEKELVKELDVTWGDAKAILQIAKKELGIDAKDYPEESKEEIFQKSREVAESFEKTPKPEKVVHPRDSMKKAEPVPEPVPNTWEGELEKELDVTEGDAAAIMQIAKNDLGIDQKDYPEDRKAEVFEKCREAAETFPKSPKNKPETAMLVPGAAMGGSAAAGGAPGTAAKQSIMTSQGEYGANDKVDKNKLTVAIVLALFVIAIIIGVSVGVSKRNQRNEDSAATSPTDAPTTAEGGGSAPTVGTVAPCDAMMMNYTVPSLKLTMAVDSAITEVETDYAASIFLKTYQAVLENELDTAADYCDPYCRKVNDVEVLSTEISGDVTDGNLTAEGCDSYMEMTFAIEGTWQGCEDTTFPGLFAPLDLSVVSARGSTRLLSATTTFSGFSKHNPPSFLRGRFDTQTGRFLQDDSCGDCPDDSGSLGLIAPSTEELRVLMEPFITVLPSICELTSIETVEDVEVDVGDDNSNSTEMPMGDGTQMAPEGGWTPIDCSVTVNTDGCTELMAANTAMIPCSCDGQCIYFVDGEFLGCNDNGSVQAAGSITATGCTFADHAADIDGFTCSTNEVEV